MSTRFGNLLLKTSALALLTAPLSAFAAPSTAPISTVGVLGSYNKFTLDGGSESQTERMGGAGLFYTFGNKLTAESGFIYQAGIDAKVGKQNDNTLKDAQADLDLGWRAALDARNFVDVIVGGGYGWQRYEPDTELNVEMSSKSPFAKAALGYNHQFDEVTMRVEVGARHTFGSRAKIKVDEFGSDTIDLKDHTNPYAEVSLLMNQNGDLPIMAGVYYVRSEFKADEDSDVLDNTRLKRDEFGVKVGLSF